MGDRRRMMNKKEIVYGNGAYIEATNGKLFTASKWTGSLTANSVVVISDSVSFRISLNSSVLKQVHNDPYAGLGSYMTLHSGWDGVNSVNNDMDSYANTTGIMKLQSSSDYAAGYCRSFIFPDGITRGLLPAHGWWYRAYQFFSQVNDCISTCGGSPITSSYYHWSSTYVGTWQNKSLLQVFKWNEGPRYNDNIGSTLMTRPFAAY